ncbi:MAG: ABC transporter permease [Chryseolinea sp.]
MLTHYVRLTIRSFKRSKCSFFINLTGLTLGISSALLIYLWIADELAVDKFFENDERIFQVMQNIKGETGIQTMEATPGRLAKALIAGLPEVESSASVIPASFNISNGTMSVGDNHVKSAGQYVSEDFLKIFSYKLLDGTKEKALADKKNIVISDKLALKLFKSLKEAVGKTISWSTQEIQGLYIVSAVFQSPPANATRQFDFLLNYELYEEVNPSDGWSNSSPHTYILLKKDISQTHFNSKINEFIKRQDSNSNATLFVQGYSDRYLHGQYENGESVGGRISYIKLFSIIGALILVIASINFMNLSTARSLDQMKSVGIRKTLGARRSTLAIQHLIESMLMSFISLALAILVADLSMTTFNSVTGKHLHLDFNEYLIIALLALGVFTGLFSGSYPAFYLSRPNPAKALMGKLSPSVGGLITRKGLIVFQFAIAVILVSGVAVVYQQMKFIQEKNLGFNRNQVLYFPCSGMTNAIMAEIQNISGVVRAGGGRILPGNRLGGTNDLNWEGKKEQDDVFISTVWMSFGLIETLDMKMAEGYSFVENSHSLNEIIFNERAIQRMHLKDPVGKKIRIGGEEKEIIGVVKNFHFESLYEAVKPCALLVTPIENAPNISVNIQAGTEQSTIASLQKLLKKRFPNEPFDFKFMNDDYQKLYAAELRVSSLAKYFAFIAIVISSMGLFGLATFIAQRRTKEIGIRKVLGSSVMGIVYLLSIEFTKTVLLAILIATPVSYLAARFWLDNFAFKITLEWWFFAGVGFFVLVLAWLTVGTQAIKAALVNPTECLRDE